MLTPDNIASLQTELERIVQDDPESQPTDEMESRTYLLGTSRDGDPTWDLIETQKVWNDPWKGFKSDTLSDPDENLDPVEKGAVYRGGDTEAVAALGGSSAVARTRYEPAFLYELVRSSAHLRAPIDAYIANIETEYTFDAVLDFDESVRDDLVKQIRGAMMYERFLGLAEEGMDTDDVGQISDAAVEARISLLEAKSMMEWYQLNHIFSSFVPGSTFLDLRQKKRDSEETAGVAYWEIIRENGIPRYGCNVRSPYIREVSGSRYAAEWLTYERVTPAFVQIKTRKRLFRRYVERYAGVIRYYKEYGDTRDMDAKTGKYYPTDGLPANATPATEIFQWDIHDALSPTGCPRWTGVILGIQGSMAADRVNLDYFQAKPPAGILLVSGTRLSRTVRNSIERQWDSKVRGEERFHGLVVIEAVSPTNLPSQASGKIGIEFVPLTETQTGDALFQTYDENNAEKVGAIMRIPPILRGRSDGQSRANGQSSEKIAESQVFSKERTRFDGEMNTTFLPDMGITLWKFRSKAPDPIDYEAADKIIDAAKDTEILTLNEQRREFGAAMNITLPETERELTKESEGT